MGNAARIREASANNRLAQLPSPHAMVALRIVLDGESPVAMVLPRFETSLSDWLRTSFRRSLLDAEEARKLCSDVFAGVSVLHRANVIHRDIQPCSIMVREKPGESVCLAIADHHLALAGVPPGSASIDVFLGTTSNLRDHAL